MIKSFRKIFRELFDEIKEYMEILRKRREFRRRVLSYRKSLNGKKRK
jgi:hypothetical protein